METCVVGCRMRKPEDRRRKILFINAVDEVTRKRAQSFLTVANQKKILAAYRSFVNRARFYEPGGVSAAGGKLYVADTNNHSIRVVDLKTAQVSTLKISGLLPPVLSKQDNNN